MSTRHIRSSSLRRARKPLLATFGALAVTLGLGSLAHASVYTSSSPETASEIVGESGPGGAVGSSSGAAVTSVPFTFPSARGEAGPSLALSYNSQAGEGEGGLGWHLDLPSIRRVRSPEASSPEFPTVEDRFEWAGQSLVRLCGGPCPGDPFTPDGTMAVFRLQGDPLRATFYQLNGGTSYRVVHRGGLVETYGGSPGSTEGEAGTLFKLALTSRTDRNGNRTVYTWSNDPTGAGLGRGVSYLTHIFYNPPIASPNTHYGDFEHHVALSWERPGEIRHAAMTPVWAATPGYRLRRVHVSSKPPSGEGEREIVRRYNLTYLEGEDAPPGLRAPIVGRSFLHSVAMEGRCEQPIMEAPVSSDNPATPVHYGEPACPTLPPTTFTYDAPGIEVFARGMPTVGRQASLPFTGYLDKVVSFDVDKDGYPDLIDANGLSPKVFRSLGPFSGIEGANVALVEDCLTSGFVAPPATYPVDPKSLFGARTGMTVAGPWAHSSQAASFLFRGTNGNEAGTAWLGAHVTATGTPCSASEARARRSWKIVPEAVPELAGYTGKVAFTADVNGDGIPDALLRTDSLSASALSVALSKRAIGAVATPSHVQPFRAPGITSWAGVGYNAYAEPDGLSGTRGFVDMDGDGLVDAVATDRFAPQGYATYYGRYGFYGEYGPDDPRGVHERRFISHTVLSFVPGTGASFRCDKLRDARCKERDPNPMNLYTSPISVDLSKPILDRDLWFGRASIFRGDKVHLGVVQIRAEEDIPSPQVDANGIQYVAADDPLRAPVFADVNGDGFSDVVTVRKSGPSFAFGVYLNEGGTRLRRYCPQDESGETCNDSTDPRIPRAGESYRVIVADIDASGVDDIVVVEPGRVSGVSFVRQRGNGLLSRIDNGRGGSTSFSYTPYQWHASALARARGADDVDEADKLEARLQVVSSVETSNGLTGVAAHHSTETYRYRKPAFDTWYKTFRGFGEVTTVHAGGESTQNHYMFGACDQRTGCDSTGDNSAESVHAGRTVSSTRFGGDPDAMPANKMVLDQTLYEYENILYGAAEPNRSSWRQDIKRVTTRLIDGKAKGIVAERPVVTYPRSHIWPGVATFPVWTGENTRVLVREQDHDANGNLSEVRDFGEVKDATPIQPIDEVIRRTATYAERNQGVWVPLQTTTSGDPGSPVRRVRMVHDYRGNMIYAEAELAGTEPLQRVDAGTGTAGQPMSPSGSGWVRVRESSYDAAGNITFSHGPMVETVAGWKHVDSVLNVYDTKYAHQILSSSVDLDGVGSAPARKVTTSYIVDRGLDAVRQELTSHGTRTLIRYDAFGRVSAIVDPSDAFPNALSATPRASFSYEDQQGLSRVHSWHRLPETAGLEAGLESIAFIDGLGVTRLHLQEGVTAGSWLATGAAVRNARGQIVTQGSVPSAYAGSLTNPTLDLDADAVPVTQTYDAYGRPTSTWEGPPSGASVGTRVLARMAYSPLKHVSQDANDLAPSATLGSSAISETDGHGRLVRSRKISNAHSSTFEYAYLPTGEAIRERRRSRFTGESTVRERTFDTLGRMVKQLEPNTTTNGRPMLYAYNDAGWLVGTSDSRGCGENVAYDPAGRVVYRDSSPCTQEQGPYTPPAPPGSANFGDGTEAFYRYDTPEPGESAEEYGHAAALPGRIVAQRDLGTHTRYKYDALGRSTGVGRRVTLPGRPSSPLADRYTEHWYRQETAYDINDRVVSSSTGADVPELLAPGLSTVSMTYGRLGQLDELQSSYGLLIHANVVRPDGRTQAVVYGDQASTTVGFEYYESHVNRPVFRTTVARNAPARWSEPDYTPASPTEPTQQTTLSEAIRFYDDNQNPTHILEMPNGLPEGASSRNQHVTYDDMDRVSGVTYDYFGNDARTSPFAHEAGTSKPVPRAQLAKRTQAQSFEYDYLGNITSSRSDAANGAFDRHLGTELHGSSTNGPSQLRSADGTTARYDSAGNLVDLMVERPGPCDAGKPCTQRFHYVWNETGQLERASRWDLTLAPGESAGDTQILLGTPTWDLRYAYSDDGQRVLKSAQEGGQEARHTLEVFGSLRVENARFDGADYERTGQTEKVSLAGVGKVEVLEQSVPDGQAGEARLYLRIPDALGSSSFVLDQRTSEVVEHTTYDAFGTTDSDYRPERWGAHRDAHKFTGKEEDIEVGLVYFGARYYHPNLRRWISPDPLTIHGWGADPNPYAYVSGQVLRQTDPWGLTGFEAPAPNPNDPGCGHCTAEPIGPGMDAKPEEKGSGGSGKSSGSGESRPPPPPPPPPGAASQVRGALASFGASVGAAAFSAVKWSTDYSRTAMFTVLTAGAVRRGHALEDPRHWVQKITGVPESSSAGMAGMAGGIAATVVLEAPVAAAAIVQKGAGALNGAATHLAGKLGMRKMVTIYHGTTASAAARIVANGFKPGYDGLVYFAEDMATADFFAKDAYIKRGATGRTVTILKLRMPASMLPEFKSGPVGAARNAIMVDVGSGYELMLGKNQLDWFNDAIKNGVIGVARHRVMF